MHPLSKTLTFTAVLSLATMVACQQKTNPETAKITVQSRYAQDSVRLYTKNVLNYERETLQEKQVDSTGTAVIEIPLSKPAFAYLQIGKQISAIYLAPGYNLQVALDSAKAGDAFTFAGTGTEPNTYMAQVKAVWSAFYTRYPDVLASEPDTFINQLDALKETLTDFHRNYANRTQLTPSLDSLLTMRNESMLLNLKQQYKLVHQSDQPELSGQIPFDEKLLQTGMEEYAQLIDLYHRTEIVSPLYQKKAFREQTITEDYFPAMAHERIQKGSYPAGMREFLMAKNIDYWLAMQGITQAIDSLYGEFTKQFSSSAYLPPLKKEYQHWMTLSAGQPAPEIAGVTSEGKRFSLRELKGKVVYIDLWATWCQPCKAEFPHAKKLRQEFAGNEQVAFLYVSIDEEQEKWRNYLAKDQELKGIQIIEQPAEKYVPVMKAYKIWGIPRYMLIDQSGNIVSATASRPSSGKVKREIAALLQKKV